MSEANEKMQKLGYTNLGGDVESGGRWFKGGLYYGASYGKDRKTGDYKFTCKTPDTNMEFLSKQPIEIEVIEALEKHCHQKTGSIYYPAPDSNTPKSLFSHAEEWDDTP